MTTCHPSTPAGSWLSGIPASWGRCRAKYVFTEIKDVTADGTGDLLSVSEYTGVRPRVEIIEEGEFVTRADSLVGYRVCRMNDLVMNIMLAWKRGLGFSPCDGIVSPAYAVFRVTDGSSPRFLHYLLRSDEYSALFGAYSYGVIPSRWRLYPEVFMTLPVVLPPLREQELIAAFLDRETTRIDAIIEKKQRQIELLEEKRVALISQAVTKGLDPGVRMKDSGVEWLGEVPKHWDVWKAAHAFATIGSGTTPKSDNEGFYGGEMPWVTTSELRENTVLETAKTVTDVALRVYPSLRPYPPGTVLVAMYGATIGRAGVLGVEATTNQACCAFVGSRVFRPRFFFYCLISSRNDLVAKAVGGGQPNLSQEDLRDMRAPAPPIDEQDKIVAHLDEQSEQLESLRKTISRSVELLHEYRSSLISAAVTGHIDVLGEVAAP